VSERHGYPLVLIHLVCQSVTGLGKGWAGHGLGTGMGGNWARTGHRLGTGTSGIGHGHERDWAWDWAQIGHRIGHRLGTGEHGTGEHGRIVSERHGYPLMLIHLVC